MTSSLSVLKQATEKARYDPDWFCETILRVPNDQWQSEMMNAIADLDRIKVDLPTLYNHEGLTRFTICAFHGPGKTHFIATVAHWWNFTRIGVIPCTAPKLEQLKTRTWREFRKILRGAVKEYQNMIEVDMTRVRWNNDPDWCMNAESASTPENLSGYHDDNLLYLVEEASGVDEEMYPSIEGALTDYGAVLVLIGNPTRNEGEFYRSHCHLKTMPMYYRKKIQHHESTRINPQWVKNMVAKYGKNSPVVQVRVFGNFVEASEGQLLVLSWLEDARHSWQGDGSIPVLKVSGDIADGGEDETVITVALEFDAFTVLKRMYRFSFPPAKSSILAAEAMMRITDAELEDLPDSTHLLIPDGIGVGAGTAGVLLLSGKYDVRVFKAGSTQGVDTKQWRNLKTRSYCAMRDGFRDGKIIIDPDFCDETDWEDFLAQMCSVKTKPGTERIEEIMSKKEMKALGLTSPDMSDSASQVFVTDIPLLEQAPLDAESYAVQPSIAAQSDF